MYPSVNKVVLCLQTFLDCIIVIICACVGTEEIVDARVKEIRVSGAQAVLIQKIRNRSLSVGHYPLQSQRTDHVLARVS